MGSERNRAGVSGKGPGMSAEMEGFMSKFTV